MRKGIDLIEFFKTITYHAVDEEGFKGCIGCKIDKPKYLWWLKIKYFFLYKLFYKFHTITLFQAIQILSRKLISLRNDYRIKDIGDIINSMNISMDEYALEIIKNWYYKDHSHRIVFKIYCMKCIHANGKVVEKIGPIVFDGVMDGYLRMHNKIPEKNNISYVDFRVNSAAFEQLLSELSEEKEIETNPINDRMKAWFPDIKIDLEDIEEKEKEIFFKGFETKIFDDSITFSEQKESLKKLIKAAKK